MNYILHATTLKYTVRLQWVHSALNQQSHPPLNSSALLKQLHWLPQPLEWCIQFKLTTVTSKALHTGRLPYLTDLLQHDQPTKSLRSSFSHQQFILRQLTTWILCFPLFSPTVLELHVSPHSGILVPCCFKHCLKMRFSSLLIPSPSDSLSNGPWFVSRLWRYINFFLTSMA